MKGQRKKQLRRENLNKYISILHSKGFDPIAQPKCWYHFKDEDFNFYPTTGTYYNDVTHEKGKIEDLPNKDTLLPSKKSKTPQEFKYCNLDKRYLPDWVLNPSRQEFMRKFLKQKY